MRAVGNALDDLPGAMRAAGRLAAEQTPPVSAGDEEMLVDEELALVLNNDRLTNAAKARLIQDIFDRRERDRQRRLEETRKLIDRAS